jgi:hypothetical protein
MLFCATLWLFLLEYYAEVLPPPADDAAEALSGLLSSGISADFAVNLVEV